MRIDNEIILKISWSEETSHGYREEAEYKLLLAIEDILSIFDKAYIEAKLSLRRD